MSAFRVFRVKWTIPVLNTLSYPGKTVVRTTTHCNKKADALYFPAVYSMELLWQRILTFIDE